MERKPIMSLIKCPECGNMVSLKADTCPSCGYPIKENICKECGNLLEKSVKVCPSCGCPVDKHRQHLNLSMCTKSVVFIPLICIIAIILLFVLKNQNKGYYGGLKWGTSYQDILDKYGDKVSRSSINDGLDGFIDDYDDIIGLDAMVHFSFNEDDGLRKIAVILQNNSGLSTSYVMSKLKNTLSKSYGKSETDEYGYNWKTGVSQILLHTVPPTDGIIISYQPLNK